MCKKAKKSKDNQIASHSKVMSRYSLSANGAGLTLDFEINHVNKFIMTKTL